MFSVIIPLYNKAPYIEKAIRSVAAQTCQEFELIVIDDGSTDIAAPQPPKGGVIISYSDIEALIGEKGFLLKQSNSGVSNTRNIGVKLAKYDHIVFLDADDWWAPTYLEEMKALITKYPEAGIYGSSYFKVKNGKHIPANIGVEADFEQGLINYFQVYAKTLWMPLWTGATILRKDVFNENNGFKPDLKLGEDFDLCEGDDYWTDPYKLQKQVDILEANENIVAVATNAAVCDFNGNTIQKEKIVISPDNKEGLYNLHEFFSKAIQYPTLTVMFRNRDLYYITSNLDKMANPFLGDWTLWVLLHTLGDFYFINQVTASYRVNPNSVTHTVNAVKRWEVDFMIRRKLIEILPAEYHIYLKDDTYAYHMMGMAYRKQKKMDKFVYYQIRAFLNNPVLFFSIYKNKFR